MSQYRAFPNVQLQCPLHTKSPLGFNNEDKFLELYTSETLG